jgi:hypothetical protein
MASDHRAFHETLVFSDFVGKILPSTYDVIMGGRPMIKKNRLFEELPSQVTELVSNGLASESVYGKEQPMFSLEATHSEDSLLGLAMDMNDKVCW